MPPGLPAGLQLRLAVPGDVPRLRQLIEQSARELSRGYYTATEIDAAIRYVFGVDSTLIADRTYFVVMDGDVAAGCGGWSFRRTLYGGDQRPMGPPRRLDPRRDAARIRAFFVSPAYARRGVGRGLLAACTDAAIAAGFRRLELMATLPGVPFYAALGFEQLETVTDRVPDGTALTFVRMARAVP